MLEGLKKFRFSKETKQVKDKYSTESHKVQERNCHHTTVFGLAVNNIYVVLILKILSMDLTKT